MKIEWVIVIWTVSLIFIGIVPMWINRETMKTYLHTQSAEKALYKMSNLKTYLLTPCYIGASLAFMLAMWKFPEYFPSHRWVSFSLIIVYMMVIVIYSQLIFHRVIKQIRHTDTHLKDELWASMKELVFILLPIIAYKCVRILADVDFRDTEIKKITIYIGFMLLIQLVYPYLTYLHLGARPIRNIEIRKSIASLLNKCQAGQIKVYEYPAKKRKAAHAWVTGIVFKKIFIADYLIEQLTKSELHSVIAHEIGHCKKHHHIIMTFLLIVSYPLILSITKIWEWIEQSLKLDASFYYGLGFLVLFLGLYYVLIIQTVSRKHEHQADLYVLQVCEKNDLISALSKLTHLNHQLTKFHKWTEKLHTHPSLENRIKSIENGQRYSK